VYTIVSVIYLVLSILAFYNEDVENKFNKLQKVATVFISICVMVLIATSIYITTIAQFNGIGVNAFAVQGRYFLPIALVFILIANNKKKTIEDSSIFNVAILLHLPMFLTMLARFIV